MRNAVVDAALRVAALALAGWALAVASWAALEVGTPRLAAARTPTAAPARVSMARAEPIARGAFQPPVGPADAVVRPPAAQPPDPAPASVPAPAPVPAPTLTIDTPQGRLSYVGTRDVVATYYTPANGGKPLGSPAYGITATGARATRGIVAVDPRVIPLYSWVYVPGYGVAQARDVGGAIIGDHIDVAFDDGDGAWWGRRYVTIYLLAAGTAGR